MDGSLRHGSGWCPGNIPAATNSGTSESPSEAIHTYGCCWFTGRDPLSTAHPRRRIVVASGLRRSSSLEPPRKLKQLEDENRKLKHGVAELTLDNRALKDVLSKNF